MLDLVVGDLTFPQIRYGTHQVPWDLRILLYKGAARVQRGRVDEMIQSGTFVRMEATRLPLVEKFHENITAKLARGDSPKTIIKMLQTIWKFFRWADSASADLSLAAIKISFRDWTEQLLHRVRIVKDMTHRVAYSDAMAVADLIARAVNIGGKAPAAALLRFTRLRNEPTKKRVLGTQADKANLEATFQFGHFLADVCDGLNVATVRGPLPATITLQDGRSLVIAGQIKKRDIDPSTVGEPSRQKRYLSARASLSDGASIIDDFRRTRLLTLRVEAELLIFIAQSGMNLAQAFQMRRESYRWQTEGENLLAYRVYKGRRGGEAIFRSFKAYRAHWERYLSWLDDTGLSKASDKMFPFIYPAKIPPEHALPHFVAIRSASEQLGLKRFGARSLRKARVNWLLRRSGDSGLTADMAAHAKETLLQHYEQPHHQRAAAEIARFHVATDPSIESPGPGMCADAGRSPSPMTGIPPEAPPPDCISPEGCLFCAHHRDVESEDYCWKLASHARLKVLEVSLYKPTTKNPIHPGNRVIDRINDKLRAIAEGSEVRAQWVRDAQDAIRAGRYHPVWDGHIQLLEVFA